MEKLISKVKALFEDRNYGSPILIASPGRINLIGEHTDYNDGLVFPAAIDRHIICGISKSSEPQTRVHAIDIGEQVVIDLSNIAKLPAGSWANYVLGVVSGINEKGKMIGNFNLAFCGDIPLGAGMSSSAALENSVVFGLNELFGLGLNKKEMMHISVNAEHEFAEVECGIMDQFSNLYGKANHALFLNCADFTCQTVPIDLDEYQLIAINTNVKHKLSNSPYNQRKEECRIGLKILQRHHPEQPSLSAANPGQLLSIRHEMTPTVYNRCKHVIEENQRVIEAKTAIENSQWHVLGDLLFASHKSLKDLYEVSCPELNLLVEIAMSNQDVAGSRMMGGGFGGCTINLVKRERVKAFQTEIDQKYQCTFGFSPSHYSIHISDGTHVIKL